MIGNQEEDEFIAVRVQDPRIQNEGSWNSYVDYKIFLHTNSKAFTAKTSCVRRRYSEFAWLKKKLQKNTGLVPVPDLPAKSFFSFSNDDFLEGRRKGLQAFLDKVLHMTVCLSDSQLHLFLQTQLPVGHIQDCVQGHTPYSVTDAILTYASSNRGFAQAQEEDSIKEPSLTVSYESMESPIPHQPCLPGREMFSPELLSCSDSDPPEGLLQPCGKATAEVRHKEKPLIRVLQENNCLEAIFEDCVVPGVSFFLGDSQDDRAEQTQQGSRQVQTPVEVHSTGLEVSSAREDDITTSDTEEQTRQETEEQPDQRESCQEANPQVILDFKDGAAGSQEYVLEDVCSERHNLVTHVICDVNVSEHVVAVSCPEEVKNSEGQSEPNDEECIESESEEKTPVQSEIQGENHRGHDVPQAESSDDDTQTDLKQAEQEVDSVGSGGESDEDGHSLPSSNGSIVKVSDEESTCDNAEEAIKDENGYMASPKEVPLWSLADDNSRNILDLHMNGGPEEKGDISAHGDVLQAEEQQYMTELNDLSESLDTNSTLNGGDLTDNSDFSVIDTSCSPGLAE